MAASFEQKLKVIRNGAVIPATPLALDSQRRFNVKRQRALMRYYIDAGAGGVAVGMHFTQFEIRKPGIDLYRPVLTACAQAIDHWAGANGRTIVKIAVFNILGEPIATLADGHMTAGEHRVQWYGRNSAGRDVPTGVYCYRLVVRSVQNSRITFIDNKKMMLIK